MLRGAVGHWHLIGQFGSLIFPALGGAVVMSGGFVVGWGLVAQARVKSLTIVERFNVFNDRLHRLLSCFVLFVMDPFGFHGAEEAFDHRVVVADAATTPSRSSRRFF